MSYGSGTLCVAEQQQILRAVKKGIVPVAAAGNEFAAGNPLEFPASLAHVITVAAIGPDEKPTSFSNQNAAVDLSAPGEFILAGVPVSTDLKFDPEGTATGSRLSTEPRSPRRWSPLRWRGYAPRVPT